MGAIKDAVEAMQKVILLNDKVERAGESLSKIADELRSHEGRLTRLETIVEIAIVQQGRISKDVWIMKTKKTPH